MEYVYDSWGWQETREFVAALPAEEMLALYPRALRGRTALMTMTLTRRLIELGDPRAVDVALAALAPGRGGWANHSVEILYELGGARVVPAMVESLPVAGREELAGSHAVVTALARIGGAAATAGLVRHARWVAARPVGQRRRYGGEAYPETVVWALCRLGTPECVDVVLDLTRTMQILWQEATLRSLVPVADERFVPFFLELCAGPHRAVGLAGLERVATERALPVLQQIFFHSPDSDRRSHRSAARALASFGSAISWKLVPGWPWRVADADARTRRSFAWILGRVGRGTISRQLPYPAALLDDEDESVRGQAATSLGLIGDPQALPGLLAALGDPSHRVRARAATAIGRLGVDEEAATALAGVAEADPVRCVRDAAAAALRTGPR
ncbi:HEAT repeat domain-containing protein [Kitasatospora sp. NPDC058162]|uniref:HEAT repeat domain-containing protein n=1 Tax=Kitasatospora sp. NPDC058162 TaxID=3346362 RepID=UPI0036DA2177